MRQVWLRTNRRALGLGLILPALLLLVGGSLLLLPLDGALQIAASLLGVVLVAAGVLSACALLRWMFTPRLVYDNGQLLVFLRGGTPHRVPIEYVECFFLGQAPSMLPSRRVEGEEQPTKVSAVIVRIAERAKQFHEQPVHPALGQWRDGYITIRGTWCEPLTADVLRGLNHELREIHRAVAAPKQTLGKAGS